MAKRRKRDNAYFSLPLSTHIGFVVIEIEFTSYILESGSSHPLFEDLRICRILFLNLSQTYAIEIFSIRIEIEMGFSRVENGVKSS